jgi:predicted AlkP superfamily phosphohydrolase/phosphomutase
MKKREKPLLLVGWDGATFDIIDPMLEGGRLPNLARLLENGTRAPLRSTTPALTPTAWTSIATGVNPGKHGIFDAFLFRRDEKRLRFISATLRKAPPVWSVLNGRGKSSGIANVPVTYPVDPIDGYMIPGMFTPLNVQNQTHPEELAQELNRAVKNYAGECNASNNPKRYLNNILEMIAEREETCIHLLRNHPQDFQFFAFIASDRVQHFFWKFRDPDHPQHARFGNAIEMVYERLDQALGRIVDAAPENTTVMMVSDHGAGPLHTSFYLNKWLADNGYLAYKPARNVPVTKKTMTRATAILAKFLPRRIAERIGLAKIKNRLNAFLDRIDWSRTQAFSEGVAGGIYINRDVVSIEDYDELVQDLQRSLVAVRGPDGGPVIERAEHRDEIYIGDQTRNAADIIITCAPGYSLIAPNELVFFKQKSDGRTFFPHRWSGRHEENGIFVISGKQVEAQAKLDACRVIDVAPTILHLLGEPVPEHMDGRVLEEALDSDFRERCPVRSSQSELQTVDNDPVAALSAEEEEDITERLRNLGYME